MTGRRSRPCIAGYVLMEPKTKSTANPGVLPDAAMAHAGAMVIAAIRDRFSDTTVDRMALSWMIHEDGAACGHFQYRGDVSIYPASVVKLFYLVAVQAWLEAGRLQDTDAELQRALRDAIATSSNDATSLLVDALTGTTSGPMLPVAAFERWQQQRHGVNRFFQAWGWPELAGINISQKTWSDDYYGRERVFVGPHYEDRNRLSTAAVARVLLAIARADIITPDRCQAMLALLQRSSQTPLAPHEEENQIDGFLGAGLPVGSQLYSKAGWTSWVRHDAAYIQLPESVPPYVLVVFSERERGTPPQRELLPFVSAQIAAAWLQLNKNC